MRDALEAALILTALGLMIAGEWSAAACMLATTLLLRSERR